MAKYTQQLQGSFDRFLLALHEGIIHSSISASYEDGNDVQMGETRCAVRVYERYSWSGSNRVSLSLTLVGNGRDLSLTAITSGGSQATFFKINTIGEHAFLDILRGIVQRYHE